MGKLKIAFFVTHFPAPSTNFILDQITGLIDRGHEVDIIANLPGDPTVVHPDVKRYHLLDRVCYWQVSRNPVRHVLNGLRLLLINFWKNPAPMAQSLNVFRFGRQAASLTILHAAVPLLPKRRYDIIHCHFGPNGLLAVALRDIGLLEGKVITSFYGYDLTRYIRRFGRRSYYRLFEQGDLLLPLCDIFQQHLVAFGCNPGKTLVHHVGVDCSLFSFAQRRHPVDDKTRILTIARLVEKKGLEYGIRAVARIAQWNPDIEYVIVGDDGPLKAKILGLIETLNVGNVVRLVELKNRRELVDLLEQSHLFLVPSVTAQDGDQEGTPTVLMEAAAMGLPVVSTHHSGIPEVVQDGVSGYLVPERDVDALVDRLSHLINHPELWPEMGQAGRRIVEERFNIETLNEQLVQVYQQVIDGTLP